ncbi:competence type IV pilus minor pilin ComGG [Bacillus sp. AK128]
MNNEKGYILPFVLVLSLLLFFLLSHQVSIYITDVRFYKEKFEWYHLERLIQKTMAGLEVSVEHGDFKNKEMTFEEGKAIIQFSTVSTTEKRIDITVQTNNRRKSSVILHYHLLENKLIKWTEAR